MPDDMPETLKLRPWGSLRLFQDVDPIFEGTVYVRGDVADEHKRQRDQAVNALKRIVGKHGGFQWSADIHREAQAAIAECGEEETK